MKNRSKLTDREVTIRRILKKRNLTQVKLAKTLSMHRITLSKLLKGQTDVSLASAAMLAKELNLTVGMIAGEELINEDMARIVYYLSYLGDEKIIKSVADLVENIFNHDISDKFIE